MRCVRLRGELDGAPVTLPLKPGLNPIGSGPASDLRLDHESVSRRHALLIIEPGHLVVLDLDSKNGTFLNGRKIRRAELQVGDTLHVGPVRLRLEEIDPDDTDLAVALPGPEQVSASLVPGETTRSRHLGAEDPQLPGLDQALRFLRELEPGGPDALPRALAGLRDELGVPGIGVFELPSEGEAAVLVAAGEVGGETLDTVAAAWRRHRHRGSEMFLSRPELTAWVAAGSGPVRGLAVAGDFKGRAGADRLLALLFGLCEVTSPPPVPRHWNPPTAGGELRFPEGYARGVSPPMRSVYEQLRPLIQGDLPVLITGETGVGKEYLAEILHLSSPRRQQPLVAINCAAIPAELLEAELFGIGSGVATGVTARSGKFLQAQGGTLFLDEIGEMPRDLQAKLLRALQEGIVHPVGAAPVAIDVRLVAATNVEIGALRRSGELRPDLFYRLAGYVLEMPPLRDCPEDIPILVERFLHNATAEAGKPVRGLTVRALEALRRYDWPGNVRELEHEMRRLVFLCPENGAIESSMLADHIRRPRADPEDGSPERSGGGSRVPPESPPGTQATLNLEALEKLAVEDALRRAAGARGRAAELLGITRHSLRRRIERYGIRDEGSRKG